MIILKEFSAQADILHLVMHPPMEQPSPENVSRSQLGKLLVSLGPKRLRKQPYSTNQWPLQPDQGRVLINVLWTCSATKAIVAYLPDTTYLNEQMKVKEALTYFKTFYKDLILNAPIIYLQT